MTTTLPEPRVELEDLPAGVSAYRYGRSGLMFLTVTDSLNQTPSTVILTTRDVATLVSVLAHHLADAALAPFAKEESR